jgi:hypothetical protein
VACSFETELFEGWIAKIAWLKGFEGDLIFAE